MGVIIKVFKESMLSIASYIAGSTDMIKEYQVEEFIKVLLDIYAKGDKVVVVGAGRSGLVGRAFAMRLMHLGFNVYVLGDTVVPPLRSNDLMVAISGSGRTKLVISVAEAAKSVGSRIAALTTYINSPLAKISDIIVEVPGRTKISDQNDYYLRQLMGIYESLAPLGTLFEVVAMVMLDAIIAEIMVRLGKTEEDLKRLHANIEI